MTEDYNPEKNLIGRVIFDQDIGGTGWLSPNDFADQKLGKVWAAILEVSRSSQTISDEIVTDAIKRIHGNVSVVGGTENVASHSFISGSSAREHADCVHKRAIVRRMAMPAQGILNAVHSDVGYGDDRLAEHLGAIDQAYTELQTEKSRVHSPRINQLVGPAFGQMERRSNKAETPILTPWSAINNHIYGGLWPGQYILVGGTGTGKTQFALQIALEATRKDIPALYIALELGTNEIVSRLTGIKTDIHWSDLHHGKIGDEQWSDIHSTAAYLEKLPLHIEVAPPHGLAYSEIYARSLAIKNIYRKALTDGQGNTTKPFLVVLDFLQLVASPKDKPREDLRQRITNAAYQARAVARDLNAVVLLVSSTARNNYEKLIIDPDRDKPDPGELVGYGKESGEIEYSSDGVFVLAKERGKQTVHMCLAKGRAVVPDWIDGLSFDGNCFREQGLYDLPGCTNGGPPNGI